MNPEELILRDIHLPDPVSWWPPAIGWWLFAGMILISIIVSIWMRRRRQARRRSPAAIAERELARLRMAWAEHGDTYRLVNDLSAWLRRAGMSVSSRQRAASLTGTAWLEFLDDVAGEPVFGAASTQLIAEAPYRQPSRPDGEEMLVLCERWLGAIARPRKNRRS